MPEQNWPTLNISCSPHQTTSPLSLPRSRAQPRLPVCWAALCSTRSSALSAGDRLFGIYPLLLCLSLHLQPFMAVKSSLSSPLSFSSPSAPPPLTLQLNSFHHPPTAPIPSHPTISAPNPILLKTVIEHRGVLGLGPLLRIFSLLEKFG